PAALGRLGLADLEEHRMLRNRLFALASALVVCSAHPALHQSALAQSPTDPEAMQEVMHDLQTGQTLTRPAPAGGLLSQFSISKLPAKIGPSVSAQLESPQT